MTVPALPSDTSPEEMEMLPEVLNVRAVCKYNLFAEEMSKMPDEPNSELPLLINTELPESFCASFVLNPPTIFTLDP